MEILGNVLTALEMKPVFFKGNLDRTLALSAAGTWRQEFPDEEKFYQFTGLKRPNDKANVRLTAGENV